MHALDVLGDPVRRRILELLVGGDRSSGELIATVRDEFGLSQPVTSQHLRVLRDHRFVTVTPEGTRRVYAINPGAIDEADIWLDQIRSGWEGHLDALATEIARGKRERRSRRASVDDRQSPAHDESIHEGRSA